MAPEVRKLFEKLAKREHVKIEYCLEKADVFSLGLIILDMCVLDIIDARDFNTIQTNLNNIQDKYPKVFLFLKNMLEYSPTDRKTFSQLHLYITNWGELINSTLIVEVDFINQSQQL